MQSFEPNSIRFDAMPRHAMPTKVYFAPSFIIKANRFFLLSLRSSSAFFLCILATFSATTEVAQPLLSCSPKRNHVWRQINLSAFRWKRRRNNKIEVAMSRRFKAVTLFQSIRAWRWLHKKKDREGDTNSKVKRTKKQTNDENVHTYTSNRAGDVENE